MAMCSRGGIYGRMGLMWLIAWGGLVCGRSFGQNESLFSQLRSRRSGPTSDSNFDVLVGSVKFAPSFDPSGVALEGQGMALRRVDGSVELSISMWISDIATPSQTFTGALFDGPCTAARVNGRTADIISQVVPSMSATGTVVAGGALIHMLSETSLAIASIEGTSLVVTSQGGDNIACADLSSNRIVPGSVGSVNDTYLTNGDTLPTVQDPRISRTETGTTIIAFVMNNYRAGFPYTALASTVPCLAGIDTSAAFTVENGDDWEFELGVGSSGSALSVSNEIQEVADASAVSLIVRDCLDAAGDADFGGSCVGGHPFLICVSLTEDINPILPTTTEPESTTPNICSILDVMSVGRCTGWASLGYCEEGHRFYSYMQENCHYTCNDCASIPPPFSTPSPSPSPTRSPSSKPSAAPTDETSSPTPSPTPSPIGENRIPDTTRPVPVSGRNKISTTTGAGTDEFDEDGECILSDSYDSTQCDAWRSQGLCTETSDWFVFMLSTCAQSCTCDARGGNNTLSMYFDDSGQIVYPMLYNDMSNPLRTTNVENKCGQVNIRKVGARKGSRSQMSFLPDLSADGQCCLDVLPPEDMTTWYAITGSPVEPADPIELVIFGATTLFLSAAALLALRRSRNRRTPDTTDVFGEYAVVQFAAELNTGTSFSSSQLSTSVTRPIQRSPPRRKDCSTSNTPSTST